MSFFPTGKRARIAYRALLRREPAEREVRQSHLRRMSSQSYFHFLRDMVDSEEFAVQILPGLVVSQTGFKGKEPVFFLHVPKTGGTSIRLLIGQSLGVPAINIYHAWSSPDKVAHAYWPFWAGHAQLSFFPESHTGITLFREPRSRVLSLYRQQQAEKHSTGGRHGWTYDGNASRRKSVSLPDFSDWLPLRYKAGTATAFSFFIPSEEFPCPRTKSKSELKNLMHLPEKEISALIGKGLDRFSAAAWIHDSKQVLEAVEKVSGTHVSDLPHENSFESKDIEYSQQIITRSALAILEDVYYRDSLLTSEAQRRGLIRGMDREEADGHFEKTARRLGFQIKT